MPFLPFFFSSAFFALDEIICITSRLNEFPKLHQLQQCLDFLCTSVEVHFAAGGRVVKVQGSHLDNAVILRAPALPDGIQHNDVVLVSQPLAQLGDCLPYAFHPITCPSSKRKPLRTARRIVSERFFIVCLIVYTYELKPGTSISCSSSSSSGSRCSSANLRFTHSGRTGSNWS